MGMVLRTEKTGWGWGKAGKKQVHGVGRKRIRQHGRMGYGGFSSETGQVRWSLAADGKRVAWSRVDCVMLAVSFALW